MTYGPQHNSRHRAGSVAERLRAHGVMPTPQRLQIASLVLTRPIHFSAEQLHEQIGEAGGARVSKATVYNTLGLFVRKGLLREVLVDPSKIFYDSNMHPHHHFYDIGSGELEDIDSDRIEIAALPEAPEGLEIDGVDVVVRVRRNARV